MDSRLKDIVVTDITDVMMVNILGGNKKRHITRNVYGLSFCNDGEIIYDHDGRQFVSDSSHVMILPKGMSYTIHEISPGLFPVINFTCTEPCSIDEFIPCEVESMGVFMNAYEYLQRLFLFKREDFRFKALGIMYEMLSNLTVVDYHSKEYLSILPGIRYMEENFSDPMLSVEKMASVSNMSVAYFRRRFENVYGTSPRKYLIDIRIKRAKQLLNANRPSIQDISASCGFASVHHFCRCFKDIVGCTATDYYEQYGMKGI